MKMPDIWGQGSLFAFSGLDGECFYHTSLVGSLCGDRLGVMFHTNPSFSLVFQMTPEIKDLQYEIITSDFIKARLALRSGKISELNLLFYNQNTVIGRTPPDALPHVFPEDGSILQQTENTLFANLGGKYVAFSWRDAGSTRYFSLNVSNTSLEAAIEDSRSALNVEWEPAEQEKLRYYEKLPVPPAVSENDLYRQMKQAINTTLWDDTDRFYYDRDLKSGEFRKVKAVSSFLPLFAGVCGQEQAEYLVQYLQDVRYFGTRYPIPSVALEDPTFGTDMWRGPVWINYNYMIATGLQDYGYKEQADEILKKTIEMVMYWYVNDGNIYEFYDSTGIKSPRRLNRKGHPIEPADFLIRTQCIHDYGWSCSLIPEIILKEYHSAGQKSND